MGDLEQSGIDRLRTALSLAGRSGVVEKGGVRLDEFL
jgi:hypothetical protein